MVTNVLLLQVFAKIRGATGHGSDAVLTPFRAAFFRRSLPDKSTEMYFLSPPHKEKTSICWFFLYSSGSRESTQNRGILFRLWLIKTLTFLVGASDVSLL